MVYYPAEHVYWLGIHDIIKIKNADDFSRWSCQAWGWYIVLDIIAILMKLERARKALQLAEASGKRLEENDDTNSNIAALKNQISDLRIKLIIHFGDLPLALHWSVTKSPMPKWGVGFFGSISSFAGLYLKWKYAK